MNEQWNRRRLLKHLAATSAALTLPRGVAANAPSLETATDREIQVASVSEHTVRLTVFHVSSGGHTPEVPFDGSLVQTNWPEPSIKMRGNAPAKEFKAGNLNCRLSLDPIVFTSTTLHGEPIQRLSVDGDTGVVSFATGDSPLLGLGEGGPQFDRRGSTDKMVSGQGGNRLQTRCQHAQNRYRCALVNGLGTGTSLQWIFS